MATFNDKSQTAGGVDRLSAKENLAFADGDFGDNLEMLAQIIKLY